MKNNEYLITENPLKALWRFTLPMILGSLFQQFYNTADSIVVGRFIGQNALAAVGASAALTTVFICIAVGAGVGASVLVSKYFGSRDYSSMKTVASTSMIFFLLLSIILGALGIFISRPIMRLLNTPEEILEISALYLRIYFAGFPFLFMYNILSNMFNSIGKSYIPLYLLIFSSILNVALDLWMVASLKMGILGAAIATLISQGISAVISFVLFAHEMKKYKADFFRFNLARLFDILRLAVPSVVQQSTVSIGMMLVQSVVNIFGAEALAGYSATMRIENIFSAIFVSIGNAVSPFVAQNLGAEKKERIWQGYHAALLLDLIVAIIAAAVIHAFSYRIANLFLGNNGTTLAYSVSISYMKWIGTFFIFMGIKMATDGVLRGLGSMNVFMAANLINLAIRLAVAMIFAPHLGIGFVWYAVPAGWLANFLISYAKIRKIKQN